MNKENKVESNRRNLLRKSGIALSAVTLPSSVVGAKRDGEGTSKSDNKHCACPEVVAETDKIKIVRYIEGGETVFYRIFKEQKRIEYKKISASESQTPNNKALTTEDLGEYSDLVKRYDVDVLNIGSCSSWAYQDHSAAGVHIETNKSLGRITGTVLGGLICLLIPFDSGSLTVGCGVIGSEVLHQLNVSQAHELSYWFWDFDSYGAKTYRGVIGDYYGNYSEIPDGKKVQIPSLHISPLVN